MCRIVAYIGQSILLKDILVVPKNSIIMQSLHARETSLHVNGDGFGVGWYVPEIDSTPALFTSIAPAWNDRNLLNLTAKTISPCFFAHVRAASAGGVTTYNCHPFVHGDWMFMHNGEIHSFNLIKRHIRRLLDDDTYNWIKGDTDSEHIFALFLQLAKDRDLSRLATVADVLQETLQKIAELIEEFGKKGASYYNICLTDGRRMIATRYCTDPRKTVLSFHYLKDYELSENGEWKKEKSRNKYVLVSSEKLNDLAHGWEDIPAQHMMLVDENKKIHLRAL